MNKDSLGGCALHGLPQFRRREPTGGKNGALDTRHRTRKAAVKVRNFVNPCGATQAFSGSSRVVNWPKTLKGLKVRFLENGKSSVVGFFDHWALLLASSGAEAVCRIAKEGPMAKTGDERYRRLQACCDLVIVGVCDGGTAASVGAREGATLA